MLYYNGIETRNSTMKGGQNTQFSLNTIIKKFKPEKTHGREIYDILLKNHGEEDAPSWLSMWAKTTSPETKGSID